MAKSLQVTVPDRVAQMAADAAKRRGCSVAAYSRQGLYAALRADGLDPTGVPSLGFAGVQEWALVDGDQVLTFGQFATKPADDDRGAWQRGTWLPMVYADSAPFDPDKHYRLAPEPPFVEGGRVIRRYPVVDKSEAA